MRARIVRSDKANFCPVFSSKLVQDVHGHETEDLQLSVTAQKHTRTSESSARKDKVANQLGVVQGAICDVPL